MQICCRKDLQSKGGAFTKCLAIQGSISPLSSNTTIGRVSAISSNSSLGV